MKRQSFFDGDAKFFGSPEQEKKKDSKEITVLTGLTPDHLDIYSLLDNVRNVSPAGSHMHGYAIHERAHTQNTRNKNKNEIPRTKCKS